MSRQRDPGHPITMVCPDLGSVPRCGLPGGYALRWYAAGDEAHWIDIHRQADLYNEASVELFRRQFGARSEKLVRRQCYLVADEGRPIGTATAWLGEEPFDGAWGRVHWVAIVPDFQGRGLAKPLLSAVCGRLRELGHTRAYLTSSTSRIPALNLYSGFGFRGGLEQCLQHGRRG